MPAILRFADAFPVGPGRPRRNLFIQIIGGVAVVPIWSFLVAIPVSAMELSIWGLRPAADQIATAVAALFVRGPYISIIYGLIAGLAAARRLADEQQAAATRTVELQRALVAADLAQFTEMMGADRLVDRLQEVERLALQSPDEAEAETLVLADELHAALLKSRTMLRP